MKIGYHIREKDYEALRKTDLTKPDESDLLYRHCWGAVTFECSSPKPQSYTFHTSVLDCALSLKRMVGFLQINDHETLSHTESGDLIHFIREPGGVRVMPNWSEWSCICPLEELQEISATFLQTVIADLCEVRPQVCPLLNAMVEKVNTELPQAGEIVQGSDVLVISDYFQLQALKRSLIQYRFSTISSRSGRTFDNPYVAAVLNQLYDVLISATHRRGHSESVLELVRNVEEQRGVQRTVKEYILTNREGWRKWSVEKQRNLLIQYFSPYQATADYLEQFLEEINAEINAESTSSA